MKKLSLFVLLAFIAVQAAAPTAPTQVGGYFVDYLHYGTPVATSQDTLSGVDTTIILNKVAVQRDAFYVLGLADSTGAADSIKLEYTLYGGDKITVMAQEVFDTIGGATNFKQFRIPVNQTAFGEYMTVKAIKWVATLKAFIKRYEVWGQKSTVQQKNVVY